MPSIAGLANTPFHTYKDVFSLKALPRRLLVLGSGPIGAELAQAFHRLGSAVCLVEAAGRLLPIADPEASAVLLEGFTREGVEVYLRSCVGFIKLAARNDRLVGATVVAPVAGELINELAFAIESKRACGS